AQLEAERLKFAGFFNQAPIGYFVLNYIGAIEEANQSGAELLKTTTKSIIGERFQSFISPQDLESFYHFLHAMKDEGKRQNFETKLSLDQDKEIYTRMEGIAVPNELPDKNQYYITVVDVTESKLAEQQLLDTSERLKITLSASSTGTWTMESGKHKIFLDDFSCLVLNVKPGEFDGNIYKVIELAHPDDRQRLRDAFFSPEGNGNKIELEFQLTAKDGKGKTIYALGHRVESRQETNYFAGILMDVTLRKTLARQAEDAQEESQRLILSTTFRAQEKERDRISSALHDSICQILYGIRLNLQHISMSGLSAEMQTINSLLDQAIQETREISYELTPSVLRDFGFAAGIKEISQRFSGRTIDITVDIDEALNDLPEDTQLYLFRIVQELINNCLKHSGAKTLKIQIHADENWINLITIDDGRGFDLENLNKNHKSLSGNGIRNMYKRAMDLGGKLTIVSAPQKGTVILLVFNL
ncbi:MAG: PAS domain-containing protein, partial [Pedobacter sp.]